MKTSSFFLLFMGISSVVFAQSAPGESFFDKYLPIAKLFDSPVFFGIVVGSAVAMLLGTFVVLKYAKRLERKAVAWAEGKTPQAVIELLNSPVNQEAQLAYVYLNNHADDKQKELLTEHLKEQRRSGNINPTLIHLLEDIKAYQAIPLLEQIGHGKSRVAPLARQVADYLSDYQEYEQQVKAETEGSSLHSS